MTDGRTNGKITTISARCDDVDVDGAADLEKAISATGYGTFNVLLLIAALPAAWTGLFDTTTTAFILASAECDLQLTFFRKGVLLAFPYIGITLTSFMWDHVTPYVGARNLFVAGLLLDTVLNIVSTVVDSYYAFLAIKFLSGVLVGGPFSIVLGYLSEFHSAEYKAGFTRWAGLLVNVGIIVPAVIAFLVLPLTWEVEIFDRRYNTWRIYLLICTTVPLIGLLTASTLPQTPKYLLEIGRTEDALNLLRTTYAVNRWMPADTFPIKKLLARQDAQLSRRSLFKENSEKIRLALYNTKQVFSGPYLRTVSLLGFLQFGSMLAFNTMRLWVPHMFMILSNFDAERWTEDRPPTMSEMLDRRRTVPARDYLSCPDFDDICMTWTINASVYQKSAMIATSAVTVAFLAGIIATTKFRKKILLLAGFLISVVGSFGSNWGQAPLYMLLLCIAIIVTTRVTGNVVNAVNADVIPTLLRSTSLNVLTTFGNLGAILGNLIFSALLNLDSLYGFIGLGCLMFACFCLSFLPLEPVKPSPKSLDRPTV
ncbi:synaptic vesicle glycoprotein 2B-like [Hylaeus volcanicus]|uniref:synaptic vesicle glycoprotein 2B-like n=1 Tax=Hylaeus volcanicus TaxID=313075 RepID=UPI0023B7A06E|nr:synaptic vesicle glycoprotein 2B-like [Hylaeus volcanicus]XP_053987548.1 synaptic vesicle glycoprotein 2B-like [Hylaeus volcanicus]XP_053987549.1 synaptic vesicle glycoprotein 2B-like [Hylaeus volcanicus]